MATCRTCGCTDERACEGGCFWVEPDLCSACASTDQLLSHLLKRLKPRQIVLVLLYLRDHEPPAVGLEPAGFVDGDPDGGHAND